MLDKKARQQEREVLRKWLSADVSPTEALEMLKPSNDHAGYHAEQRQKLTEELATFIEPKVVPLALAQFKSPAGIQKLREKGRYQAIKYVFRGSSMFWSSPNRQAFLDLLGRAGQMPEIHRNSVEFMQLLVHAAEAGFDTWKRDETKELLQDHDPMKTLWSAVIARKAQYRFLGAIRELRQEAEKLGVSPDSMPEPEWLREPAHAEGDTNADQGEEI